MKKKFGIYLIAPLLLLLIFAACSSRSKVKPTYIPKKTPVETAVETSAEAAGKSKEKEIEIIDNLWTYGEPTKTYILNDMENLNAWVPRKLGDISEDLKNHRYGTKGLKITSVNNAIAWGGFTFPTPVNLYKKIVTFSVFINDITSQDTLSFIFFNGSTSFSAPMKSDSPNFRDLQTGWNTISLNPEQWSVKEGTSFEDLKNITAMRITVKGKPERSFEVTTDMIMTSSSTIQEPMFTFTFDDGYNTDYKYAFPILSNAGFPGVSYIVTGTIGTTGKLSLEALNLLQDSGWDISSHTSNHTYYKLETFETFKQALIDSRQWLLDHGFTKGADHFSYPGGWNDNTIRLEVAKLYKTARLNIEQRRESVPPSDIYRLKAVPVVTGMTLETIRAKIDATLENGQWLIFMFHKVVPGGTGQDITPEFFEQIVDYLVSKNAKVVTMSEAIGN
ncbi:MAG: polysaccharide deacetylase family protein [Clostridiaceae bacterium]